MVYSTTCAGAAHTAGGRRHAPGLSPFCISVGRLDLSICVCRHLVCKSWCWRDRRRRGVHCCCWRNVLNDRRWCGIRHRWCWRDVLNHGRLCSVHCGCRQRRGRHRNCRSCCDRFGRKSKHVSPRCVLTTKNLVMQMYFVCRNHVSTDRKTVFVYFLFLWRGNLTSVQRHARFFISLVSDSHTDIDLLVGR